MVSILALTILLAIYAFGEIIAQKTKSILSATMVIALVLLIAFWCGLPATIFETAGITSSATVLIGILITSLGTRINFKELKRQWKTVLISIIGVTISVTAIIVLAQFVIGHDLAIAGAPIFAGANTAALVMIDGLTKKGLESLSTFCILILVTQNFIGIPIASMMLRREAKSFIKNSEMVYLYLNETKEEDSTTTKKLLKLPSLFEKPSVYLVKLGMIATISYYCATWTQGKIHYFVFALLFGILFHELGFLETDLLTKSHASSLILAFTTLIIFTNLSKTTPQQLVSMIIPLIVCLGIGITFAILSGVILGKIFSVGQGLSIAIILSCTFGFPTTLFIPSEVASAVGNTEEEKLAIQRYLEPKMLTGGFVTVTIFSVILAGIIVGFL